MNQHNVNTKKSTALIGFLVLINVLLFISIIISRKYSGRRESDPVSQTAWTKDSPADHNQISSTASSSSSTPGSDELNVTGEEPTTGTSYVQNSPDATTPEEPTEEPPVNESIAFPDSALEKAIREELKIEDREITREDALQCEKLNLSGAGKPDDERIKNLVGLSEFVNLTSLDLRNNRISNIDELRGLHHLQWLNLESNQVSDLTPLAELSELQHLDLFDNQVENIRPISRLAEVKMLDIRKNRVSDISMIGGMSRISELYLGRNQIEDINALSELQNLTSLGFGYNRVKDISALYDLPMLHVLTMNYNLIEDIGPVAGMK